MRFVAQHNNFLCCVWFLFNDALCIAAKNAEGQLSMDENVRPHSGCITSTEEVKPYLFGNQGEQRAQPGKGLGSEELAGSAVGTADPGQLGNRGCLSVVPAPANLRSDSTPTQTNK